MLTLLEIGILKMCCENDMKMLCLRLATIYGREKEGTVNQLNSMSFQQFRRRCVQYMRQGGDSLDVLVAYLEGGYKLEYKKQKVYIFRNK